MLSHFYFLVSLSLSQVIPESGSVNGQGKAQMDDTHTAAEEDEGEEGHIPHTQSPPISQSLTHNLASGQAGHPALIKREAEPELTSIALNQHVCSSVTFQNGSAEILTKPGANGANMTTVSHSDLSAHKRTIHSSEPQRTIIARISKECSENGPKTPLADMSVPLKRIKLEDPWMWITEQSTTQVSDEDEICEDPLSTLAAVVCLSVTERKGLEEKLFNSRSSILCAIKTEPPDLHLIKKEPEDLNIDFCQKNTPISPQMTPQPIKIKPTPSVLQPSVQSLAEKRNLSFDQAIAIEALTQLAAIPQNTLESVKAESKCEHPISTATPFSPCKTNTTLQEPKTKTAIHFNKVSVISSPRQQASVICPPVARQGNVIQHSEGLSSNATVSLQDHSEVTSDNGNAPCRKTSHVIKLECSYKDPIEMKFGKDRERLFGEDKSRVASKVRRNRDEEEVAAQLADLAFIIQSRHNQQSEKSPLKGTPVSAIKYNYISQLTPSQKKTLTKKTKAMPSKPRKKKSDGLHEGINGKTPLSKCTPKGEVSHRNRGKNGVIQGKSGLQKKMNLFLPLSQIDFKRYLMQAQEERGQLIQYSNAHNTALLGPQSQDTSTLTRINLLCGQETQPWSLPTGPLHQRNCHASEPGQEFERHLLSQVTQPYERLQHASEPHTSPANATFLSHTTGHYNLANGFSGARQSPPPSQQGYYKLERSGPVTVLSSDGDLGHSAESTPSKNSISSFLESPMSFLDTPTKNLLNTPSKKLDDLPSCQCMGELMLTKNFLEEDTYNNLN